MTKESAITPELKVSNFKESLDFYTKLAGFEVLYDRPENDFAMLGINGSRLMIEGLTDKSRAFKVGNLEKPFGRGMHFQVEVENVDALYKKFKEAGHPIFREMEERWYRRNKEELGNKQFLVQDPDGYLFRLFQDLGSRSIK